MATVFVNGGSPDYTGLIFTTTAELLETIRDNLVTAGWTTTTDNITSSNSFISRGVYGTDNCWIKFSINTLQNDHKELTIQGDIDGSNTILSPNTLVFSYIETAQNLLWLSADEGGGCICIQSFNGNSKGVHFGFVRDRVSSSDNMCIYVGYLSTYLRYTYVANPYYNTSNWHHLEDSYDVSQKNEWNALNTSTANMTKALPFCWGLLDRFTCNLHTTALANSLSSRNSDTDEGPFMAPHRGQLSPISNSAILGDYYYIELQATNGIIPINYTVETFAGLAPQVFYFRGFIRFAAIGLASLSGGTQVEDTVNNHRYLSVASPPTTRNTDNYGWQGFRIL